ncbi:hypothetical protein [Zhaonella formicivorans]|uniref:hypothetical protein n=1 Tax=Zhaonella formicivorans TaxID=2528593 RepID=UPI0010E6D9A5|nr:hypothetical protein [Zhaonella formicivorans]
MLKKVREILKSRKGANEVIAFVILLIFILLAVAPKVKGIGSTTGAGVDKLNNDLKAELGVTP